MEDFNSLEGFINPDQERPENYEWPDTFQQQILGSLILDDQFLVQAINLIKPEYFRHNAHDFICKRTFEYYEKYKGRPTRAILETCITDRLKDNYSRELYLSELDEICRAYRPGIAEREYFLDRITEFAKTQAIKSAYYEATKLFRSVRDGKWDSIREVFEKALLVERNTDFGLDYFESLESRYQKMLQLEQNVDHFPTGFESIDQALKGGICRGELGAFAGMSGSGKSLSLVKAGKANLMKGWNVLYFTLEISESKTAERFDAMLSGLNIGSLYTKSAYQELKGVLYENRSHWGDLFIKQFPAGMADVNTLRAFLAQLHARNWQPDVVLVDYIGEMKDNPMLKTYESRQRLVRDLRGLAQENKFGGYTALQLNRSGRDAMNERGYIDDDALADSAGQVRPLDALWTISQNEKEQAVNCGTLFASKHRSGRGRFLIRFKRDENTLEMREISDQAYAIEMSKASAKAKEDMSQEDQYNDYFTPNRGSAKPIDEQVKDRSDA